MVVGGNRVDVVVDRDRVEVVVDGQGTSVVELVGPVPVVGGGKDDEVLDGNSVVVVPGVTVVVVAAVVVVVPDGGAPGQPSELATDPRRAPAPGKPANAACSDWSSWQMGPRKVGSSWGTT